MLVLLSGYISAPWLTLGQLKSSFESQLVPPLYRQHGLPFPPTLSCSVHIVFFLFWEFNHYMYISLAPTTPQLTFSNAAFSKFIFFKKYYYIYICYICNICKYKHVYKTYLVHFLLIFTWVRGWSLGIGKSIQGFVTSGSCLSLSCMSLSICIFYSRYGTIWTFSCPYHHGNWCHYYTCSDYHIAESLWLNLFFSL